MDWQIAHLVEGSELLVAVMGYWPAFHDANVLRVERSGDTLTVVVHVFQMTSEVDARGHFVLTKHHLVTFELLGVIADTLPEKYDGDILFELAAERAEEGVVIAFVSVIGPEWSWQARCARVRIAALEPGKPDE
jgi:hypothetical protein